MSIRPSVCVLAAAVALVAASCTHGGGTRAVSTNTRTATTTLSDQCPSKPPTASTKELNAAVSGLEKKLVPIAAVTVLVCRYPKAVSPLEYDAAAATQFEAETNTQYAEWLRKYPPADVARVRKIGFAGYPDAVIVSVLEAERGCAVTRSAWAAAKAAAPGQRAVVVDSIMRGELPRLRERNWPPQSQMANIFQRLADQLATGDLATFDDGPRSLFEGECGHSRGLSPSTTTSPPVSSVTTTPVAELERCQLRQLRLAQGVRISEPTGQHTLSLTLTNTSSSACSLFGYPGITIVAADGRTLPFVYAQQGDQVVSSKPPRPANLAPGARAYITINKYRCDLGDKMIAAEVSVTPPGETDSLSVALGSDTIGMNYCGPGDTGSRIYVSSVAATLPETLSH